MNIFNKSGFVAGLFLGVFMMCSGANAAQPAPTQLMTMQGVVNHVNTSRNIITVSDMSFAIGHDIEIKTPAGNKGTLSSLLRGKRISMQVELNGQGDVGGTIHKIQILK